MMRFKEKNISRVAIERRSNVIVIAPFIKQAKINTNKK